MGSWKEVEGAVPLLAARVRERFEAYTLGLLATLRKDGSPRITGVEPLFALDELWLGMMPGSLKAADLRRDPRFGYHSATVDKDVAAGDARISGRLVEETGERRRGEYLAALKAATGFEPEGGLVLFRADVTELSFVRPEDGELVIRAWREGGQERRIARR
jgi:hypothetical protein